MERKTKITIATVCFNAEKTIGCTLESVGCQDYPCIEHLIVDGASKDGTMELVSNYADEVNCHEVRIVSEPDKGLYDAMNKALRLATGDYIVFLNAGDRLHSPLTISHIASQIEKSGEAGVVYGRTNLVDSEGQFIRERRLQPPAVLTWRSFLNGMLVCHQSFYANLRLAREEMYNLDYRFSADVDWCIRIMRRAQEEKLPLLNANEVLTDYLSEGLTTANHRASLLERFKVMSTHYGLLRTIGQHLWFVFRAIIKK